MPIVSYSESSCPHRGLHPIWNGRDGKRFAVCLMPLPYLRNVVKMLSDRVNSAYPMLVTGSNQSLVDDEATLLMLQAELDRRCFSQ